MWCSVGAGGVGGGCSVGAGGVGVGGAGGVGGVVWVYMVGGL